MVDACNDLLLTSVVRQVNAAHCFSVLADETADVSGTEQFSLFVRYMDCSDLYLTVLRLFQSGQIRTVHQGLTSCSQSLNF